jgi:hypothetical protein
MKTILKSLAAGAALFAVSMTGTAQADGTSPAFPFAATGFAGGGGSFLSANNCVGPSCDSEIGHIVAGGDFVIPVTGYWNIQFSGAFFTSHIHEFGQFSQTQFQGSGLGFWRDPMTGAFGVEAGLFSPVERRLNYAKLGGVGEYYWGDMATISVFGGAMLPTDKTPFGGPFEEKTGFYTGGHLTWYASSNLALAAFGSYLQNGSESPFGELELNSLKVGAKARYLTNMPGIELFASAAFQSCWLDITQRGQTSSFVTDGVEVMAGINIRLGGNTGSLADIDRSNAIDTRAWECPPAVGPIVAIPVGVVAQP